MPESIKAFILGCLQGVTEFFPISSSAHLIVFRDLLGLEAEGLPFDVAVHIATLLAIFIYFRREIVKVLLGPDCAGIILRLAIATLPSVVLGLLLRSGRESLSHWAVVGGWVFSGTYLLLTRGLEGRSVYPLLGLGRVLVIGVAQSLALFPGVSRSGATISSGLWMGLTREEAARFSFLLAIPAILGAGILETVELLESPGTHDAFWQAASIAMPAAFGLALLTIHLLLKIVRKDRFHLFGFYNLLAAAGLAVYLLAR